MKKRRLRAVLVAVNAQYIHTGLGVRTIAAYVHQETDFDVKILECTINNHMPTVLEQLYACQADVYLFSCYIWNIDMVLRLVRDLRLLCPDVKIGLGGPQVSYHGEAYIREEPDVDFVLVGEGEETVCQLLALLEADGSLKECYGLIYKDGNEVWMTSGRSLLDVDNLAFAYPDIEMLQNKIVYYESMRGCPYSCSYCISSIDRRVRKRSLQLVFADLKVFLLHKVAQVKFVDRTFNCDGKRARSIWEWLVQNDNGVTNFHFELSGELLDEDTLDWLASIRQGLFQFEVGVQSTNPKTLSEIERSADVPLLFERMRRLVSFGNIHVHLDLIAGLPYEDFESFAMSFQQVYSCKPHQLQVGFLKVLSGSKMERTAEVYDLVYSANAPYEVLHNRWISYSQLRELHGIAAMVDTYHNTGRFAHLLGYLISFSSDFFRFYLDLWLFYHEETQGRPVSQIGCYDILYSFAMKEKNVNMNIVQWLAKYDLLLHQKPRRMPTWLTVDLSSKYRKLVQAFLMNPAYIETYLPEYVGESSLRIERTAHVEVFPFDPEAGTEGEVMIVINYRCRHITGQAWRYVLPMKKLTTGIEMAVE